MKSVADLQRALVNIGKNPGPVDGLWGPRTQAAFVDAFRGDTTLLAEAHIEAASVEYDVPAAHIGAVCDVEASGRGFDLSTKLPLILFEPHWFRKLTGGKHDAAAPTVSHAYKARPYPRSQSERWVQMTTATALDPSAALQSASWGLFQVMGFNHRLCGYDDPFTFALAMGAGEKWHLHAAMKFIRAKGALEALRFGRWEEFERLYNGVGGDKNPYDTKLAAAAARRKARA